MTSLPPGWLLMLGALVVPLLPRGLKKLWMLALPAVGLWQLTRMPLGDQHQLELFDYALTLVHVDKLALVWGYIFHIAAFLSVIYALKADDDVQYVGGLIYAGSAVAAVFAGDMVTLFVYWELTAVSSVFLIWAVRTDRSFKVGLRYLVIQVTSGVLLLAGVLVRYQQTGSLAFETMSLADGLGAQLIFLAFGIKCAFPLLHNWLQDAYPEATVYGTVFLSAFTTKLAVYALARGFAGTEQLIWIGAVMTAFPIFYAVIENDLRRVLAYSLNNQLGFMVVGIGIGTELSLDGTAAHAFCHILYKALLFMSMGAVLLRTGTCKGSELGGLYRSMPLTMVFCCVGAASISAFPLFSGFVSKSLIVSATAENHHTIVYFVLLFASAGVFHHSGIKIPYFAFFAHDRGWKVKEAPWPMLLAMGITAALCVGLGVFPQVLYAILPFDIEYVPYTTTHVITQLQLLMWSALAFSVLNWYRIYPPELRSTNLDTDWIYRRAIPAVGVPILRAVQAVWGGLLAAARAATLPILEVAFRHHGRGGVLGRTWPTGSMALWVAILLVAVLIVYYV